MGTLTKAPTAPQSPHKGARTTTAQLLFSLSSPLYTAQQLLLASKRPTATGPKTWWSSETVWIQKRKKVAGSFSPAAETRLFPHLLPKHQSSSPLPMRRCRSREGWWEKKKNGDTIFWQHPGVDSCFHAESGWKNSGNWYTQLWCCYLYKANLTERDRFNARCHRFGWEQELSVNVSQRTTHTRRKFELRESTFFLRHEGPFIMFEC